MVCFCFSSHLAAPFSPFLLRPLSSSSLMIGWILYLLEESWFTLVPPWGGRAFCQNSAFHSHHKLSGLSHLPYLNLMTIIISFGLFSNAVKETCEFPLRMGHFHPRPWDESGLIFLFFQAGTPRQQCFLR